MQRIVLIVLTFALVIVQASSSQEAKSVYDSPINWRYDYPEARKEAQKRKLPLFIFVTTSAWNIAGWNGCQKILKGTLENSKVVPLLNQRFVPLDLYLRDPILAAQLKIDRCPMTLILDHNGKELIRIVGDYDVNRLTATFQFLEKPPLADEKKPDAQQRAAPVSIQWRTDYNEARKEAEKRKLPIFVFLRTSYSRYCQKLEQETLADAKIAVAINERCVPLRIEADKDPYLSTHLQIAVFPTTVIADHEGKILRKRLGFQDVETMTDTLQRLPNQKSVDAKNKKD